MQAYRVCVADDDVDSASVLCEGLRQHGYEAFAVHSGEEALSTCREGEVDLVLLDVCFPGIDGYEVCRRLKADRSTQRVSVIFVTVKGAKEDIARGYQMGAADYITKPYNLPMVMVRVDAAMQSQGGIAPADEVLLDSAYTDQLTGLRNRRYLLERLDEEVEEAHRHNYPLSCIVFDIDEVNALDPELGPVSVDDLLVELAMTLRDSSRSYDVLARYDGTMFAAVLPHAALDHAIEYAGNIMSAVESTTFSDPSFPTQLRLSAGVVACQNGTAKDAEYVLGEAMRSLFQAKSKSGERLAVRNLIES